MGTSDGVVVGTTKIVDNGPATDKWNLVLVAEGYREPELPTFAADAQGFVDSLFATPPFDDLRLQCAINVYRIDVSSTDSGADDPATDSCPGTGATARTYFDATFCGNNVIRRLLVANTSTVVDVLDDQVPEWHEAIVIVNSATYGGAGGQIAVTSTSGTWERIAIHELGHAAFGLADEYEYYAGCGIDTDRDNYAGGEPAEPNVTINTDRATIKWGDLIDPATPLPTTSNADCTQCDPQPSPVASGVLGAFEGARYYHCGLFRPEFNCLMRQLAADFCAVCQRTIRTTFEPFLAATEQEELELIESLEQLLHSFEQLLAGQRCQDVELLKSFEGLLHSFERLLHDRQRKRGALERQLLQSFECLLYSFTSLLDRLVGLPPTPIPERCAPEEEPEGLPDLIPVAPFPPPTPSAPGALPQNFCFSTTGGQPADAVRIVVRNQGDGGAGDSMTEVVFGNNAPILLPTPALSAGQEAPLEVSIPRGCYRGESPCTFRITVDATGLVAESNEANNSVSSSCPGVVS
ncbi:MAG: hypothetical protein LC808_24050 [Actinobacteria bacterium]|nr:hypothetical protein [Actinomycetota bacterium]